MTVSPGRRPYPATRVPLAALLLVLLLAACSSSGGSPSAGGPSVSVPTATPSASLAATSSPAASESAPPTAVVTDIDPCQLVTADEASALTGASYDQGKESSTKNHLKICTYGSQTLNIFTVEVLQAPDEATAQAGEAQAKKALQNQVGNVLTVQQLPNFEDGVDAAVLSGNGTYQGQTISTISIVALKGTFFLAVANVALNQATPTSDAMQAQARTALDRLP